MAPSFACSSLSLKQCLEAMLSYVQEQHHRGDPTQRIGVLCLQFIKIASDKIDGNVKIHLSFKRSVGESIKERVYIKQNQQIHQQKHTRNHKHFVEARNHEIAPFQLQISKHWQFHMVQSNYIIWNMSWDEGTDVLFVYEATYRRAQSLPWLNIWGPCSVWD